MKTVYVAHPLGDGEQREANRKNAAYWCGWIAATFEVATVADWIVLASVWDEGKRELGLKIDFALIERCHEVWLVGGRVSPGMALEREYALKLGKPVHDLTYLGWTPPAIVVPEDLSRFAPLRGRAA